MLSPPIEPMLARLSRELPAGAYFYEPKWDGFRCLAFVSSGVDLRSRHQRPLARYFPEVVGALREVGRTEFVLDGELVIGGPSGFDFPALLGRLHPAASRVERLAREMPATFVAFDALAVSGEDVRERPFETRRAMLEELLGRGKPGVVATPITRELETAQEWLRRFQGKGIDGVVAKHAALLYQPGRRAMVKVKQERTADCVLAGFRVALDQPVVASLLLGLYDGDVLRHVGVSSSFPAKRRRELFEELLPLTCALAGHPWESGFNLGHSPVGRLAGSAGRWDPREMEQDWVPLRPERVCEVAYDQLDGQRFRHPARLVRFRPDREPRSCGFEQLLVDAPDPGATLHLA
ncbi:MAG TPA: ATP-dependent DNA ligase [Myxococcales bacterium]|nr:ATP-dependent DNA ligase [Myxococcales bacterium]